MTTLADYQLALVNLLQSPAQPTPLIAATQQAIFVNQARQHVAAEGECVRVYGNLPLVVAQRSYAFAAITFGAAQGIAGVNNVRTLWYTLPNTIGQTFIPGHGFGYFSLYNLNNPVPASGMPAAWSQLGQGQNGTIFVDPLPDIAYQCPVDIAAAPSDLAAAGSVERAIPPLWIDAVPFYAAWLGFMNLLRSADADRMMQQYATMMQRARLGATSGVLPGQSPQGADPMLGNRLGLSQNRGGGGSAEAA
jgi:hypothetical protein